MARKYNRPKSVDDIRKMTSAELIAKLKSKRMPVDETHSRHQLITQLQQSYKFGYDLTKMSKADLAEFVKSQGKAANTRLAAIEKSGHQNTAAYQYVSSKMSGRESAMTHSKSGSLKFNVKVNKKSRNELLAQARRIEGFLEALSSTATGRKKLYQRSLDAFNEKYSKKLGKTLSMKEFNQMVTNDSWEHFKAEFGSDRMFSMVKRVGFDDAIELLTRSKNVTQIRDLNQAVDAVANKQGELQRVDIFEKINLDELPESWR